MKLFVNNWNIAMEDLAVGIEENREYPINAWVTDEEGKQLFLASAYVYDGFVMFFYMYDLNYERKPVEQVMRKPENTQRDVIENNRNAFNYYKLFFEYEVNGLKSGSGRPQDCTPSGGYMYVPKREESDLDDTMWNLFYGEYDYLVNLVKETDRVPHELKGKELAFKKDSYAFEQAVEKLESLAIYPQTHNHKTCSINKTFTVPYGTCDIKVPYADKQNGVESYFIVKELKLHDMLEEFDAKYDEYKALYDKALLDYEENKEKLGEHHHMISLEEMRQAHDKRILMLSLVKPEEKRSFHMRTNEFLDSKIVTTNNSAVISTNYYWHSDEDPKEGDLYKAMAFLCEFEGELKSEYEITLLSVTDNWENERIALFERKF